MKGGMKKIIGMETSRTSSSNDHSSLHEFVPDTARSGDHRSDGCSPSQASFAEDQASSVPSRMGETAS